jgi:multidrug transporter EmrE-like cation transporter
MAKGKKDTIDTLVESIEWKMGGFSLLPVFFGTILASLDIAMMGTAKMVSEGTMPYYSGSALAVGMYALVPLIFIRALRYEGMVVTNLVWNLMSNVIVTLQGVFIFGESIKGLRWVGIAMSLVSLALLAYTDE